MKKMTKAATATVTLAASLTMLVAGCGSGSTANNSGGGNTATNTTAPSANTPVNGGTLTIGQSTKYNDEFIPLVDGGMYTMNIDGFAYDGLMNVNNKLDFIPSLAKSWSWSANKKTVTIHLQPNANWSDGKPITSADVLFTLNYLASPAYTKDLQGQYGYVVGQIVGANKIGKGQATSFAQTGGFKTIDSKTFSITFTAVDAAVLYSEISTLQPVPSHILKNIPIKTWATAAFDKMPTVVSGPYKFVKVNGEDSVQMTANENYWQGPPHIKNVVWKTVSSDIAPGLLANGKLDFMMNGLQPKDVSKLKAVPGVVVHTQPDMGYQYLGMKLYQKEFQNVKVRQAFEYAINRKAMIQGLLKGLGQPINGPLPSISWAAATTADGMNPYNYDPAKANQLLDAAGWKKAPGSKWRIDPVTGKIADIPLDYPLGNTVRMASATAIQQDLAKVGVKIKLNSPMDFNTLSKKVENDDKHMYLWLMGWGLAVDPDPRGLWDSTDAYNFPRWKDSHNDALIKNTWDASAFNKSARKAAFVKWQLYVNQQLPYIFLYQQDDIFAYNSKLHIPAQDWSPGFTTGAGNVQDWWISK